MTYRFMLVVLIVLTAAGCAAPQPARPQATATAAGVAPAATATRVRAQQQRPTQTPEPKATTAPTATVAPTMAPTTALKPSPTATAVPADATSGGQPNPQPVGGAASGVVLALSPYKYSAPAQLAPDNGMTFHVSQPVVRMAWLALPTDLVQFGQMTGCVSDATNFRRALESYQLVIRSLDVKQPDIVQWTEIGTQFDFNLTTVPQGRYAWSVSVAALCESYIVGQKASTTQRYLLGPVSPASAARVINWVP